MTNLRDKVYCFMSEYLPSIARDMALGGALVMMVGTAMGNVDVVNLGMVSYQSSEQIRYS